MEKYKDINILKKFILVLLLLFTCGNPQLSIFGHDYIAHNQFV